jgi:hypothetical protein
VTTDFGGPTIAEGIAIRGDRKLVAVGCTSCLDVSDFAVARYKRDPQEIVIPC